MTATIWMTLTFSFPGGMKFPISELCSYRSLVFVFNYLNFPNFGDPNRIRAYTKRCQTFKMGCY